MIPVELALIALVVVAGYAYERGHRAGERTWHPVIVAALRHEDAARAREETPHANQ